VLSTSVSGFGASGRLRAALLVSWLSLIAYWVIFLTMLPFDSTLGSVIETSLFVVSFPLSLVTFVGFMRIARRGPKVTHFKAYTAASIIVLLGSAILWFLGILAYGASTVTF